MSDKQLEYLIKISSSSQEFVKEASPLSLLMAGASKVAPAASKLWSGAKSVWSPKGFIPAQAASYAKHVGLIGGFETMADENMREQHGWGGTFLRKMIDPKTHAIGLGTKFALPVAERAIGVAGKTLGKLPNATPEGAGALRKLFSAPGRAVGVAGRTLEAFTNPYTRYSANASGGLGKYIWKGTGEGGLNKDLFHKNLSALKSYTPEGYGTARTKFESFFDQSGVANKRFDELKKDYLSKTKELNKTNKDIMDTGKVDPGKINRPGVNHTYFDKAKLSPDKFENGAPTEFSLSNVKGDKVGFTGGKFLSNPVDPFALPAMALPMAGITEGPWSAGTSLWSAESPVYEGVGTPKNYKPGRFKVY